MKAIAQDFNHIAKKDDNKRIKVEEKGGNWNMEEAYKHLMLLDDDLVTKIKEINENQ